MSALSSAISTRPPAGSACALAGRSASARTSAAAVEPGGSQRSASSTYGRAPMPVGASCRAAAMRSAGRCAVPAGIVIGERRALARLALHAHVAAVQTGELVHERQADPGAFVRARLRMLHPVEALEHPRQIGRRDADAGVGDLQLGVRAAPAHGDANLAHERELEGVGQQIEDDLLPHVPIDVDRLRQRRAVHHEARGRPSRSRSGTRWRARW